METQDTIHLLKECDAGAKMAVTSLDEILEFVDSSKFHQILSESKKHHKQILEEVQVMLKQYHSEEKEPNPVARGMSWLKTNFKLTLDDSTSVAADLIIDGCNMGVKSLRKYINEYPSARRPAVDLCHRIISIEETLAKDLQEYL